MAAYPRQLLISSRSRQLHNSREYIHPLCPPSDVSAGGVALDIDNCGGAGGSPHVPRRQHQGNMWHRTATGDKNNPGRFLGGAAGQQPRKCRLSAPLVCRFGFSTKPRVNLYRTLRYLPHTRSRNSPSIYPALTNFGTPVLTARQTQAAPTG